MALVSFSQFTPSVLADMPECPVFTAEDAIRNAAIEFCRRTRCWIVELDAEIASAGTSTVDLIPPPGTAIATIRSVSDGSHNLDPISIDMLEAASPTWRTDTGTTRSYFNLAATTLRLYPTPVASINVVATVSLTPSRKAQGIESSIYETWFEEIVAGAKARLFAMNGYAWSDPTLAMYHSRKFEAACAGTSADMTYSRAPLRSKSYV